jgi:hypothetical protein
LKIVEPRHELESAVWLSIHDPEDRPGIVTMMSRSRASTWRSAGLVIVHHARPAATRAGARQMKPHPSFGFLDRVRMLVAHRLLATVSSGMRAARVLERRCLTLRC